MSSPTIICTNFAQNAWKKDLCSNCFKSEVEHNDWSNSTAPVAQQQVHHHQHHQQNNFNINEETNVKTPQNVLTNQSSIKPLNKNQNFTQISNPSQNNQKLTNDCLKTANSILTANNKKFSNGTSNANPINNCHNNPSNTQIVMNNTKIKLNSTHVSSHNSQIINGIHNHHNNHKSKDNIKQYSSSGGTHTANNNCLDFKKVIIHTNSGVVVEDKKESNANNNTTTSPTSAADSKTKTQALTRDTKPQVFPQLSAKDKHILNENNLKNNTNINNSCNHNIQVLNDNGSSSATSVPPIKSSSMPLTGILKSTTGADVIKFRPKNKCLVFKEGDPLVIGYGLDSPVDDYSSDEEADEESSDDDYEDETIYTSDDKELRDLTHKNTLFNANYNNFSHINDNSVKQSVSQTTKPVIEIREYSSGTTVPNGVKTITTSTANPMIINGIDCQQKSIVIANSEEQTIPKVCEKLVEIGFNEAIDDCLNSNISADSNDNHDICSNQTHSPDSGNCDITPMSTSSDSYSSGDEKDDSQRNDFTQHLMTTQVIQHLRTDSESDTLSTNSDSSLEMKSTYRPEFKCKPQLPVKPNMSATITTTTAAKPVLPMTITVKTAAMDEQKQQNLNLHLIHDNKDSSDEEVVSEECSPKSLVEHIYQEISDSNEEMSGISGKFSNTSEDNNNYSDNNGKESPVESKSQEHRDLKLAELAQELEQCRYMKRPAPQPPTTTRHKSSDTDIETDTKKLVLKTSLSINTSEKESKQTHVSVAAPVAPTKHRFSSIRKLLHKKSSSEKSDKSKDHSHHSHDLVHSGVTVTDSTTGADRKAWKQSEFDRTTLKIVHPIDMTSIVSSKPDVREQMAAEVPEQRPEAPPRTPKANRPSVPARKRNKSSPNIHQSPHRDPPPPVPTTTTPAPQKPLQKSVSLPIPTTEAPKAPVVDTTVQNSLNEAYNQLAKSNHSNLVAIKSKIESKCTDETYKWTDFEVTNAERMGSVLVYKDSIVSNTRKSVNLMVLCDCYSAPIVNQFRHHEELVLVLDEEWTQYYLLSELTETTFDEKQTNSLILQLYSILEYMENNGSNQLPADIINTIIISASEEDILLIVPMNTSTSTPLANSNESADTSDTHITLHQFLWQLLAKLLPNSLFASVGHVLSQPSVRIRYSKTIVQLIAFHIPVHEISANTTSDYDTDLQINYWFDINRSKFINQFCCLNDCKLLTQLDYIYLKFLCESSIDLIRNSIAFINSSANDIKPIN